MVNNISKTPFKVNIALLNFITFNDKHNLLIDTNIPHEFEVLEKRSKYQESKYRSHNSKVALQETVLEIVNFYKQFNEIYFPVRLDQRGRIYCTPSYFNYQSNELSKSLILFSIPGIIKTTDLSAISYLKAYGANCYGGAVSKASIPVKEEWVNKNIENIIDYDNGILLSKAKDKLLFLAFCMELKRFYTFFINEALMEFETYLPIQLDATCNGFQHMALLSNEKTLFKELNLVKNKKNSPKDFYNFLLHRLIKICSDKVSIGELIDKSSKGSYESLSNFVWDRAMINKAIMTIPYNAKHSSMRKYII